MTAAVPRGSAVRVAVWALHLALPLLGLWLLVDQPQLDIRWQHNLSHLLMVGATAVVAVAVGLRVSGDARLRADARLYLVALAFLASASFFGLHALATPTVLVPGPNTGFSIATPVGLLVAGAFVVAACLDWDVRGAALMARAGLLRVGLGVVVVAWAAASLLELPPLGQPPEGLSVPVGAVAAVGAGMFAVGALRFWQLHRRRRGAVLLSLLTAWTLLAESMVAVAIGPSWQLSWWLWHVTMLLAFVFVGYAAWVQLRLEGQPAGLFDGVGTEETVKAAADERDQAIERFVAGLEASQADQGAADTVGLSAAVAESFGLTERQAAVLQQAGVALAEERELARRLSALASIGGMASVTGPEQELVTDVRRTAASAFATGEVRLHLYATDGDADPPAEEPTSAVATLSAKGHEIGWLRLSDRHGNMLRDLDRDMLAAFAGQIGLAVENRRLYHELDGLFRSYMSPEVAQALIADPGQANLGGAIAEVSVLFADLAGFTAFSESHTPEEVVGMLNAYYGVAVPAILKQGGTVVQFVGDEVMAVFNTPVRQADHARRAVRAGLALQQAATAVARPGWPPFRVGVNTGPALVGNIGATQMRNFTAIGDTTNTGARIQAAAEPGTVLVSSATLQATGPDVRAIPVGPVPMKGKSEPVEVHRVEEVS